MHVNIHVYIYTHISIHTYITSGGSAGGFSVTRGQAIYVLNSIYSNINCNNDILRASSSPLQSALQLT